MAIVLYKDGKAKLFNEFSYLHELENGWSYSKNPKPKPKPKPKASERMEELIQKQNELKKVEPGGFLKE